MTAVPRLFTTRNALGRRLARRRRLRTGLRARRAGLIASDVRLIASDARFRASRTRLIASDAGVIASRTRFMSSPARFIASWARFIASWARFRASPPRFVASPPWFLASPPRFVASPPGFIASPARFRASRTRSIAYEPGFVGSDPRLCAYPPRPIGLAARPVRSRPLPHGRVLALSPSRVRDLLHAIGSSRAPRGLLPPVAIGRALVARAAAPRLRRVRNEALGFATLAGRRAILEAALACDEPRRGEWARDTAEDLRVLLAVLRATSKGKEERTSSRVPSPSPWRQGS
jgi:hypothetical protein